MTRNFSCIAPAVGETTAVRYRSKVLLARPGGRPHTFATDVYLLTREAE